MILHLSEVFFPSISVALLTQVLFFFWYPRKMKSLVPQDGEAGTEGMPLEQFLSPLCRRPSCFQPEWNCCSFHNAFLSPHSPQNYLHKKWTILPEGSRGGTQLEMKSTLVSMCIFFFQLPVKIQERVWRCIFLLTWI